LYVAYDARGRVFGNAQIGTPRGAAGKQVSILAFQFSVKPKLRAPIDCPSEVFQRPSTPPRKWRTLISEMPSDVLGVFSFFRLVDRQHFS
jgi:hypothetical protein